MSLGDRTHNLLVHRTTLEPNEQPAWAETLTVYKRSATANTAVQACSRFSSMEAGSGRTQAAHGFPRTPVVWLLEAGAA